MKGTASIFPICRRLCSLPQRVMPTEVGPGQLAWPDPAEQRPGGWASEADNIISVGALDHYAWHDPQQQSEESLGLGVSIVDRACRSLFGDAITLATEGQSVYVVDTSDSAGYASHGGTSYAAPLVSSAAALLKAVVPSLTPKEVKSLLVDSAQEIAVDGKAERDCGDAPEATWRKLDTAAAIEKLIDTALSAKVRIMSVEPDSELAEFELELELENTGRGAWKFHLDVVATSPSGVLMELFPTQVNPGSGLVTVGVLQTVPVPVSFKPSEPGTWVVRATVSRGMIDDGRQSLDCSAPDSVGKCFDEVVLEVSIDPPAVPTPASRPTPTPSVSAGWVPHLRSRRGWLGGLLGRQRGRPGLSARR